MLLEGGPGPYLHTLQTVQAQLSLETIVPGHGPMGEGQAALENFIAYMQHLQESVGQAFAAGLSLEATLAASPVPALLHVPAGVLPTPALKVLYFEPGDDVRDRFDTSASMRCKIETAWEAPLQDQFAHKTGLFCHKSPHFKRRRTAQAACGAACVSHRKLVLALTKDSPTGASSAGAARHFYSAQ